MLVLVVVNLIPPVAVLQYSIVQEKLLAQKDSQDITFGRILWYGGGRKLAYPGPTREKRLSVRRLSRSAGCSVASHLIRWRRSCPGCLPPQVGAGDHPGQDTQPRLHLRSLFGGVLRGLSPRVLPAAGPGFPSARFSLAPGETLRFVVSGIVLHILSLVACDWVSGSGCGIAIRIMSFTLQRFWALAHSLSAPGIVRCRYAGKDPSQGAAPARPLSGTLFPGPRFAYPGV